MEKVKKFLLSSNIYRGIFIVFVIVCVLTGIFSFQYYGQLQATIRGESGGYLQEISKRIGDNINQIISDNYAALHTMSAVLKNAEAESFADIQPVVQTQQSYWNYLDIMLIDSQGKAYSAQGKEIALNNSTYFSDVVLNKKEGIFTTQMIDNRESIMFTIPLNQMQIGGKEMVALANVYDPSTFDQTLSMSSFSGQAYSCIISKAGTTVVRPSSSTALKTGYNVLTTIGESTLDKGDSIVQTKDDIAHDLVGQIGFTQNNVRYYMVYTPVSPEDWYLLTFVPASVVNAKSDMLLNVTLMLCGLIALVFAGLIAFLLYTFYRNKRKLERIAYVDEVTGGNTIQRFYQLARAALDAPNRPPYALVFTNLEKFKVLNEQFGRHTCDEILKAFNRNVSESLTDSECVGRHSADNFCILMKYQNEGALLERFQKWYDHAETYIAQNRPAWALPVTEFGVFVIDNDTIAFPQMIDRAKLALRESPHTINSRLRYAVYDDNVRRRLFREKQLEDMMERALRQEEFQVYLQPKYRVEDQSVGGAEALTRWVSQTEGIIFPDEFIPLFEKNGFIVDLDLWVFEQVCRRLRIWLDAGLEPVKISVNCSRVHLKNPEFWKTYRSISERYRIPFGLLEIELTESIVMEDAQRLTRIIDEIHAVGLGCSMDDFGSGYSSLNLIQSIPVDTLKLDKIFFRSNEKDSQRTESVVGSIVGMAKALSMITVAEGVEYPEQVVMLRKIGCDYIQGYVFAKPMPIPEFEQLAFGREIQ